MAVKTCMYHTFLHNCVQERSLKFVKAKQMLLPWQMTF